MRTLAYPPTPQPSLELSEEVCNSPTAGLYHPMLPISQMVPGPDSLYNPHHLHRRVSGGIWWSRLKLPGIWQRLVLVPIRGTPIAFWLGCWEALHGVCIVCASYFIPLDLAIPIRLHLWSFFSIFLNVIFSADMLLHFVLAYRIPRHSMDMSLQSWETRPIMIVQHYCRLPCCNNERAGQRGFGMFWPDLLSVLSGWNSVIHTHGRVAAEVGRVWRVACFFRTFQLLHLNSITGLLDESWVLYGQPQWVVQVLKFILVATLACHWAACMWLYLEDVVLRSSSKEDAVSWLSKFISERGDPCEPDAASDAACVYALACYWAMMTVTGVGYGDIVPTNKMEYVACTVFMLCAGFVWAYIVGSVVSLLSSVDVHAHEFRQRSDDLNAFVKEQHVPQNIQKKVRRFILESRHIAYQRAQHDHMQSWVSQGLQGRVAECSPIATLFQECVFWARDLPWEALLGVIRALEPSCYAPAEVIPMKRRMIIIREGIVFATSKVLTRGSVHGEAQMLLESDWLADRQYPFTLSHVDVLFLTQDALKEVSLQNREASIRLRRAQIRTAVWRGFIVAATEMQSHRGRRNSFPPGFGDSDNARFRRQMALLDDFPSMQRVDSTASHPQLSVLENRILDEVNLAVKSTFATSVSKVTLTASEKSLQTADGNR